MTNSPDSLPCPSCGGQNAPDSKFCRHCGYSLEAVTVGPPAIESVAPAVNIEAVSAEPNAKTDGQVDAESAAVGNVDAENAGAENAGAENAAVGNAEERSSPAEIDARRAQQLLERAASLAERNDTAGALLACRQALALAPTATGGQAMLGGLFERSGDLTRAMEAFEKAAQLEPESKAKRDVERLRDKMEVQPDAPVFHFNDAELFDDESAPATADAKEGGAPVAPASVAVALQDLNAAPAAIPTAGNSVAKPVATPTVTEIPAAAVVPAPISVASPLNAVTTAPVAAQEAPAVSAALPPVRERRVASVPVRVERRVASSPSVLPPGSTPIGARVVAPMTAGAVVNPLNFGSAEPQPQGWSGLWARPSYFGRSLPLVAATILSLGFLGWARGLADARNLANTPTPIVANNPVAMNPASEQPIAAPGQAANPNLPPLPPVGSAPVQTGGFPISNQPAGSVAAPPTAVDGAPTVAAPRAPATAARPAGSANSTRNQRNNSQRNAARTPNLLAPAPIPFPNSATDVAPRPSGGGGLNLPAPVIAAPDNSAPATSVLPQDSTTALNPAGSSARGYVRITQGRVGSILPSRPSASANTSERAAAAAAKGGSTAQAIDGLTNAINSSSSDAGFRFQQRAQLFLSQGDYTRATDDFQSAISAYNEQIGRGDQVASARAGLRAARSGLNAALARTR